MWTWYTGKLVKIETEAPQVKRFWIEKPENFDFRAGQFITLDLPIHEKKRKRWRSYSIANSPDEAAIELCVVRLQHGAGTKYLFEEATLDTEITFKGPSGIFVSPKNNLNRRYLMVATGTGIAPIRSIIHDILKQEPAVEIDLVFGTRRWEDVLYLEEWKQLSQKPNFRLHLCLSREEAPKQTFFETVQQCYVHPVYQKLAENLDEESLVYVCGWNKMTDEAGDYFKTKPLPKENILIEGYG